MQGAKRAFIILDIVLSLIGSIALAVSSLGIVNTMVMSILERTREIGIMKAIGGSDGDIRRIFLIEASAIGFFGGVTGVVLGWLVGRIINFGANVYIQQQGGTPGNLFSLPFWLIGGAIGFSIAVSLIAGSYPGRASGEARSDQGASDMTDCTDSRRRGFMRQMLIRSVTRSRCAGACRPSGLRAEQSQGGECAQRFPTSLSQAF